MAKNATKGNEKIKLQRGSPLVVYVGNRVKWTMSLFFLCKIRSTNYPPLKWMVDLQNHDRRN